ncbi:MAG: hypothetical protein CO141_03815 [Candidatus Moranbacteria bacterium CG_4_9_14_3_um_filter_42_9]|nr:MAG: hypothetical protein CO141_03815 [Candidatus Moranbacteria bacterium CG_4_9_14_3_um_filter_42_9]
MKHFSKLSFFRSSFLTNFSEKEVFIPIPRFVHPEYLPPSDFQFLFNFSISRGVYEVSKVRKLKSL